MSYLIGKAIIPWSETGVKKCAILLLRHLSDTVGGVKLNLLSGDWKRIAQRALFCVGCGTAFSFGL